MLIYENTALNVKEYKYTNQKIKTKELRLKIRWNIS